MSHATRDEWMTITAARMLWNRCVCFVGIGLPSAACNLARLTHAPDIVLIYESGTIGTRPDVLPLSIGDGELAETAAFVVPLPEVFSHYLQGGRVDVGFLGAAQVDRFGNLNTTVIGPYDKPATRLPGAGGAPEIVAHARQTFVMLKASPRSLVPKLDFRTSAGYLDGSGARQRSYRARWRPARGDHRLRRADAASADRRTATERPVRRRHRRGGPRRGRLAAGIGRKGGHDCRTHHGRAGDAAGAARTDCTGARPARTAAGTCGMTAIKATFGAPFACRPRESGNLGYPFILQAEDAGSPPSRAGSRIST